MLEHMCICNFKIVWPIKIKIKFQLKLYKWVISSNLFLNRFYILKHFKVHGKFEQKTQGGRDGEQEKRKYRVPYTLVPTHAQSPHYRYPASGWDISYNRWTYIDTWFSSKVHSWHQASFMVLYILQIWINLQWHVSTE